MEVMDIITEASLPRHLNFNQHGIQHGQRLDAYQMQLQMR